MTFTCVRYRLPDSQLQSAARYVAGIRRDTRSSIQLVYSQPGSGRVRLIKLPKGEEHYMTPLEDNLRRSLAALKRIHKTHGGTPSAKRFLTEATSWNQHSSKA